MCRAWALSADWLADAPAAHSRLRSCAPLCRYIKRGLYALPTKFGISFTTKFLNQAGALVHVYLDGTVLVSHGGVEMGQVRARSGAAARPWLRDVGHTPR